MLDKELRATVFIVTFVEKNSMVNFDVHILGCGSATPSLRHQPSCQVVDYRGRLMMIDCGEGAQLAMRRQKLKFASLTDIFISHLHGDHFLGLPGLLSTMALHEKGGTVTVHIFEQGAKVLRHIMALCCPDPGYEIRYNIISPRGGETVYQDRNLTVTTFALKHRVPCVGYRFDEKPKPRHMRPGVAQTYGLPRYLIDGIRQGNDLTLPDGRIISNDLLTTAPSPSCSYAYASDTMYNPAVTEAVRDVDVLYHESTYGDDKEHLAAKRGHATARQAATVARDAGAGRLVLGHFSKSILDEQPLVDQARRVFDNTVAATEGMTIHLP